MDSSAQTTEEVHYDVRLNDVSIPESFKSLFIRYYMIMTPVFEAGRITGAMFPFEECKIISMLNGIHNVRQHLVEFYRTILTEEERARKKTKVSDPLPVLFGRMSLESLQKHVPLVVFRYLVATTLEYYFY